jgi:tRNA A-37 threonylcarbamoyl transferase component Bud32
MTTPFERLNAALSDRYRLERELGQGGMATVYLAEDLKHHRHVAIKVLRPELAASIGPDRFAREIEVAARLQHPHILGVLDSGDADGFFYYVMPYVEGDTLRDRLARSGELPVPEAVRLLGEIADGLATAHRGGVVHRDIKPENVMLSGRHAMVMDFGVAKAINDAAAGSPQLTTAGLALGTPAYMAPEQASADPQLDSRADIYALGVLGYEMLTGHTPFPGLNPQQTLSAHVIQAPPPLGPQRAGISPALEAVIMRCLAKRPADRFQTADDLSAALEPLAAASGGITPTETRPVPAWSAASPRRHVTALMIGAGAVVAAAVGWLVLHGHRSGPAVQPNRVQLTFTGNASAPGISQDGQRIAYATRQCDSGGRCTQDVVVQDVGGAGMATVVRGALGIWGTSWSEDERYLLLAGAFGARNGIFSVPSLGGEPRFLGCCEGTVANGDTALMASLPASGDSMATLRWVTLADGVAHDSIAIKVGSATYLQAVSFPDGQRLVLATHQRDRAVVRITDRQGAPIDSLVFQPQQSLFVASPSTDAKWLLVGVTRASSVDADAIRYPLDSRGHIGSTPDTLLRQLDVNGGGDLSRSGIAAYSYGPVDFSVWALRRDDPSGMRFTPRRLAASTGFLLSSLSAAGDQVLLSRSAPGGNGRVQLSIMPFDSGPETPLGSTLPVLAWDWNRDGRSIVVANQDGGDRISLEWIDVPSGQARPIEKLSTADFVDLEAVPGGGLIVLLSGRRFRRIQLPGLADSTLRLPEGTGQFGPSDFDTSPDGRSFVAVSWNDAHDSILVHSISVSDGKAKRLAAFVGVDKQQPRWLQDGTIIVPIGETAYTLSWYLLPAAGGAPIRLGSPPRYPALYGISSDGRRVLARSVDVRPDIFLIPNSRDMLKR